MKKIKVLEIGSGVQYYKPKKNETVIHSDKLPLPHVEVIFDLNKFPYPFNNNTFNKVVANHILEHLLYPMKTMEEVHRICRSNAIIEIEVPFFSSSVAHTCLDHRNFFGWTTFDDYDPEHIDKWDNPLYILPAFKIIERKLIFGRHRSTKKVNFIINPIINAMPRFYQRFFCWIFPCEVIRYKLKVDK